MGYILEGFLKALQLIFSFDKDVFSAVLVSLRVSCTAIIFATVVGLPLGFYISIREFRGKHFIVTILNTLMALPTVVVGLTVYSLLSRQGPLGPLNLLHTPNAMIIGQFILATPIVMALTISATHSVDERVTATALTLGANRRQVASTVLLEARVGLLAAMITGFGRIIGEVGADMMLGGNIRGVTRTMSTTIALQASMGEFEIGIALGIILMVIHMLIVAVLMNILFPYSRKR